MQNLFAASPYNFALMDTPNSLTERLSWQVDQLLARLAQAEDGQAQLMQQVHTLTEERDALQARLTLARGRIDTLLERLPTVQSALERGQ